MNKSFVLSAITPAEVLTCAVVAIVSIFVITAIVYAIKSAKR